MLKTDPFFAISDANRRQILSLLSQNGQTVNALAENFEMSRPAVSKHIKVLYQAGLVSIQDQGRERHCTLRKAGFDEIKEWLDYFDNFWIEKLNKLEALLSDNEPQKPK